MFDFDVRAVTDVGVAIKKSRTQNLLMHAWRKRACIKHTV